MRKIILKPRQAITVQLFSSSDRKSRFIGIWKHVFLIFHDDSYLCQQCECMMCPQLPVCVPNDRSGCMKRGSYLSATQTQRIHYSKMCTYWWPKDTHKNMPGLCGGLLRFLDMTVERWTKAASTMALPSVLISCSSWHRIHVTTCLLSLLPARHRRGPTQTSVVSHELGL